MITDASLDITTRDPKNLHVALESHSISLRQNSPSNVAPAIPSDSKYTPIKKSAAAKFATSTWYVFNEAGADFFR